MYNLTKENFWDNIEAKYPKAFDHFSKWIDDYKKEVGWDDLFYNKHVDDDSGITDRSIKFHDLPFEMQNSILARFGIEQCYGSIYYKSIIENETKNFEKLFKAIQVHFDKKLVLKFNTPDILTP